MRLHPPSQCQIQDLPVPKNLLLNEAFRLQYTPPFQIHILHQATSHRITFPGEDLIPPTIVLIRLDDSQYINDLLTVQVHPLQNIRILNVQEGGIIHIMLALTLHLLPALEPPKLEHITQPDL